MSEPEIHNGLLDVQTSGFKIHGEPGPIFQALAKAQGTFGEVLRTKTNPYFNSKYADLADVLNATVPHLSANGLALLQPLSRDGDTWTLRTILSHGSGAYLEAVASIPAVADWQKLGSAVTYCRRYQAGALLGVAPEPDDDGNSASEAKPREQPPAKEKSRPTPPPAPKSAEQSKPKLAAVPPPEDAVHPQIAAEKAAEPLNGDNATLPNVHGLVSDGHPYKPESFAALKSGTEELGFTKEFTREWCMKLTGKHPKDVTTETEVQSLLADLKMRREAK